MIRPEQFGESAGRLVAWIENYLAGIRDYPVKSNAKPGEIYRRLPGQAPEDPEPLERIVADLDELIMPGVTHWQHPNFHAYFPANSSVESLLAEFATAAIGAQCMIWETSPAAAELEQRMLEWLRDAAGLPPHFEGVIQDSASTATLVALTTAREVKTGFRSNENGVPGNLRVYCSEEAHSSVEKAVGICGIGRRNLVRVGTDHHLRLKPGLLEERILEDRRNGLVPCAVVATLGTTGTLAMDPVHDLVPICREHRIWLHVDGAYAGTALLLPEYRRYSKGLGEADSYVFNPHKWMFTNFDCTAYYVRNAGELIRTFEVLPEYLRTKTRGEVNDYRDWSVPLGRRFRALKLWFVIRGFGMAGIRQRLRSHIGLREYFVRELEKEDVFEQVTEPILNFTAFRLHPPGMEDPERLNELNEVFLENLNNRGRVYLTHTRVRDIYTLRMVIGQTYVEKPDVDRALEEIIQTSRQVVGSFP